MEGVKRRLFKDVENGREKVVIHSVQDIEPILESNKRLMNANGSGTSSYWQGREYVLIGRIPLIELDRWAKQGLDYTNPDDWKIIKRLLNDSDYSKLRTAPGRF